MKVTKLIKDDDYGLTTVDFKVKVNLKAIWDYAPDEDCFIHNYSSTVCHEYLHQEIGYILFNLFDRYEEFFVHSITGTDSYCTVDVKDKYLWMVL